MTKLTTPEAQIIEGTDATAVGLYITDADGGEIDSIGPNDMTDEYYEYLRAKHGAVFGYYRGGDCRRVRGMVTPLSWSTDGTGRR